MLLFFTFGTTECFLLAAMAYDRYVAIYDPLLYSVSMIRTRVQSLGWENPLVEGMAAHSSILAWRIPWTEEPGGLQSAGS